jgi:hypothetical protein
LLEAVAPLECEAQTPLECEAQTPQPDETKTMHTLAAEKRSVRNAQDALTVRTIKMLGLAKEMEDKEEQLKVQSSTSAAALAKLKLQTKLTLAGARKATLASQAARAMVKRTSTEDASLGKVSANSGAEGGTAKAEEVCPPFSADAGEEIATTSMIVTHATEQDVAATATTAASILTIYSEDATAKSTASAASSGLPSGPCPMPSSPPEKIAIGCLVQYGLESNVANPLCGQWGKVKKAVGDRVWFENQHGVMKEVVAKHVEVLESPPNAPGPWKKNITWLHSDQQAMLMKEGCLEFPAEIVDISTEVSESEMAIGCFEILWRLLPDRALVVPPYLSSFSAMHCAKDWAGAAPEGQHLVAKVQDYAKRARLLLLPILAGGHWTLLVLQRVGGEAVVVTSPALTSDAATGFGCGKCKYNSGGCMACDSDKATRYLNKSEAEAKALDPCTNLDPLPPCEWWDCRYYDSLGTPSLECARMAVALIDALQPLNAMNVCTAVELASQRKNNLRQGLTLQCGWYCLHFIEEEVRRYRGEGKFSFAMDTAIRVNMLRTFGKRMGHPGCALWTCVAYDV